MWLHIRAGIEVKTMLVKGVLGDYLVTGLPSRWRRTIAAYHEWPDLCKVMPWFLVLPSHQQPWHYWYWYSMRKYFNSMPNHSSVHWYQVQIFVSSNISVYKDSKLLADISLLAMCVFSYRRGKHNAAICINSIIQDYYQNVQYNGFCPNKLLNKHSIYRWNERPWYSYVVLVMIKTGCHIYHYNIYLCISRVRSEI